MRGPVYRLESVTDRNGNKTLVGYVNGDLTSVTDTYGRSFQLGYNSSHHLISVTTPAGDTTKITYNSSGCLISAITDPTGHSRSYTYNYLFQMISKVDRDGRKFTLLYKYNLPSPNSTAAGAHCTHSPTLRTGPRIDTTGRKLHAGFHPVHDLEYRWTWQCLEICLMTATRTR